MMMLLIVLEIILKIVIMMMTMIMTVLTKNIVMMMRSIGHARIPCSLKYIDFQDNVSEDGLVDKMMVLIVITIMMNMAINDH